MDSELHDNHIVITYHRNGELIYRKIEEVGIDQMNRQQLNAEFRRRAAACGGCNQKPEFKET